MSSPIERLSRSVKNLSETTDLRLKNLEAAVGQLNQLVAEMRMPIGALNPDRVNGPRAARLTNRN